MKMEQEFEVTAPLDRVWKALIDVEYVAPCLPGAAITGRDESGAYTGTFTVKLGPTTANYNGVLRIDDLDETNHTATLHARGTDKRGQGGATATIVNKLTETSDGVTHVHASTDFTITGRLARFGRAGMIEDISNRMLRDFSQCLQAKLAADEPQPEAQPAVTSAEAAATEGAPAEPARPAPPPQRPAPPQAAAPVKGISLFFSVLLERIKRLLGRLLKRS